MNIEVEYTDTIAGEANYSWAKRETITVPNKASDSQITKAAKKSMGLNGVRGRMDQLGDLKAFRPYGSCTVLFFHIA